MVLRRCPFKDIFLCFFTTQSFLYSLNVEYNKKYYCKLYSIYNGTSVKKGSEDKRKVYINHTVW